MAKRKSNPPFLPVENFDSLRDYPRTMVKQLSQLAHSITQRMLEFFVVSEAMQDLRNPVWIDVHRITLVPGQYYVVRRTVPTRPGGCPGAPLFAKWTGPDGWCFLDKTLEPCAAGGLDVIVSRKEAVAARERAKGKQRGKKD